MSSNESFNTGRQEFHSLSKSKENQDMIGQRSTGVRSKNIDLNILAKFEILCFCVIYLHILLVTIRDSGTNSIFCCWWHFSNVYQIKLKLLWEKIKTRRKIYVDDYDHHNKIREVILLLFSVPLPHQDEHPGHMQIYLLSYQIIRGSYMEEKTVMEKIYELYCSL